MNIDRQTQLCPALPAVYGANVYGAKDYREFRAILVEMDRILEVSGIETRFSMRLIAGDQELAAVLVGYWLYNRLLRNEYKPFRSVKFFTNIY